jgi:hypothetical protein
MARLATDEAGAAPLTGDENDPKMQIMTTYFASSVWTAG